MRITLLPFISMLLMLYMSSSYAKLENTQLSLRTGLVQGSYANPMAIEESGGEEGGGSNTASDLEAGGFMVVPSTDIVFELFTNTKKSYFARSIIAMDMTTGKMNYNYFGGGINYYYKGTGIGKITSGPEGTIKVTPKRRMYYGFDLGMSRVSVMSFGPVLSAVSTGFDFGAHWGYIRQMSDKWGLNFQGGGSFAYGVSTVSASGMNIKVLFGAVYSM